MADGDRSWKCKSVKSVVVTMGKQWTCWQDTLHWNAELPRKYVGTGT